MTTPDVAKQADDAMDAALRGAILPFQQLVEATLAEVATAWDNSAAPLPEAMRYAVLGGGKRLRPVMTMAACLAAGADAKNAALLGCALELVHCYSLVHDDLPAMDDDDERRGRPSVHIAFGHANAILVGDALLTDAFRVIADAADLPADVRIAAIRSLSQRAGLHGMVGGQVRDIAMTDPTAERLATMHAEKTGALFVCAVEMGAAAAGADATIRDRLVAFGEAFGQAFQVGDDLVDFLAHDADDEHEANVNLAVVMGADAAHQHVHAGCDRAAEALSGLPGDTTVLRLLTDWVMRRADDAVARTDAAQATVLIEKS